MIENYPTIAVVIGYFLAIGSVMINFPPLQYLMKGKSSVGSDGNIHYFMAFTGTLNIVWGVALIMHPVAMALPSAIGLLLMSAWRIFLCRDKDVQRVMGKAPMYEVPVFGLFGLYFLWAFINL